MPLKNLPIRCQHYYVVIRRVFYRSQQAIRKYISKRFMIYSIVASTVLLSLIIVMIYHPILSKKSQPTFHETLIPVTTTPLTRPQPAITLETLQHLSQEIQQRYQQTQQQLNALQQQLQHLTQRINRLASESSLQQLQQSLQQPHAKLNQQIQQLQTTVTTLAKQHQPGIHWMPASTITPYFHLVAVQGFSDGLRAIIDVDGHQTTIAAHESCPACHGWVLDQLNFVKQQTIFQKRVGRQLQRVRLQVGSSQ